MSTAVEFGPYALTLPAEWTHEMNETLLVAAEPPTGGLFRANLVLLNSANDDDVQDGIDGIVGSVVLSVEPWPGPVAGTEVIFGYPLAITSVTVARIIGNPSSMGRLVATFSTDTRRFTEQWALVGSSLRDLRRSP